jgi:hypothetical protein
LQTRPQLIVINESNNNSRRKHDIVEGFGKSGELTRGGEDEAVAEASS